ncbi:MAG: PIG-L family deacetylase [Patescibacteria group bacterium]|nr:PIG-L family deacetylase [Patescibacteria group bacterium]
MKVIFVFAHPDDESFSSGGTIAYLTQNNVSVKLITATKGETGQVGDPPVTTKRKLGELREKELRNAAKVLGISQIYFLGFIDGTLHKIKPEVIAKKVLSILKREKPDIVVTFNEEGGSKHPDHIQIHKSATIAFSDYLKKANKHVRLYYSTNPKSLVKKFDEIGLSYNIYGKILGTDDGLITTPIDIKSTLNKKINALKCHMTQKHDWERFLKRVDLLKFYHEYFRLVSENNIV